MPRVPTGKEKIDDTDEIIDSGYHEELELLKQRGQRRAYLESKGITVTSLGTSMPSDDDEEVTVIIIA